MYENFLGNKTAWKILRVLSEAPGKGISSSEIKSITKAGNFALSQTLERLEKYKILMSKKIGKKKVYWINVANEISKILLQLFELERTKFKSLQPSKIIFLAKIVEEISRINPERIILFGSHAKGIATGESDFDVCVVVKERNLKEEAKLSKLSEKVQLHFFSKKEFEELRKKKDKLIEDILKDGIELI
jgi:predicted nucleotidyltransferase/DNA-binding HxlR family transcriptional regulator